jgi:two-component system OmpR family response regulator
MNDRRTDGPRRVLLVQADGPARTLLGDMLTRHGFEVELADGRRGLFEAMARGRADLVVLDLDLPGFDGFSACRTLAGPEGPGIILMSASGEPTDGIIGLELGADDYVALPCNPWEVVARSRAILRRRRAGLVPISETSCEFAGWRFDPIRRALTSPDGAAVSLSGREFALLLVFIQRPQTPITREQLLQETRGPDVQAFDRSIDVQISRLRRKLHRDGESLIRTVRNRGYVFEPPITHHRRSPVPPQFERAS